MRSAPPPPNETQRLEALRQTGVLDTGPEESFDRLTDLAARLCEAPIALITLVDVDRQWFKSRVGLEVSETPRDVAFCAHAILQDHMLVVPNALEDERFFDNPLVALDPKIRFYAGSPLVTHDGKALGTFCVIDSRPRNLDPDQVHALEALSQHATSLLELRRTKELLRTNAEEWERTRQEGDTETCAVALSRLGDNLRDMIAAREESDASVRELERSLATLRPHEASPGTRTAPKVSDLLSEIIAGAERMRGKLDLESPLRAEATRVENAAREARQLLTGG